MASHRNVLGATCCSRCYLRLLLMMHTCAVQNPISVHTSLPHPEHRHFQCDERCDPRYRFAMLYTSLQQVTATLPFNLLSAIAYCLVVHGMSGMRSDPISVVRTTTLSALLSLISVQVKRRWSKCRWAHQSCFSVEGCPLTAA